MVKFDDVLKVKDGGVVVASGPVDSGKEKIVELCAWVFKRDGTSDAAVTEMTHHDAEGHHHVLMGDGELRVQGNKWSMDLGKVGAKSMTAGGEAFAVAVAMIEDKQSGDQQVVWWGHPVALSAAAG